MADTDPKYVHYRFNEECEDTPDAILPLVERMFKEIDALPYGRKVYFRGRPMIYHRKDFGGRPHAVVYIRFSLEREKPPEDGDIVGFGLPTETSDGT